MKDYIGSILFGCALSALTGCVSLHAPANVAGGDLINGAVVPLGALPSTVEVIGNCTSVKVGPRHILLAAHCVHNADGTVRSDFLPGKTRQLAYAPPGARRFISRAFVIEQTHIHPRRVEWCSRFGCAFLGSTAMRDAPDLAVITFTQALSQIPTAAADLEPVLPGDPILLTGFGCITQVWAHDADGQLRSAATFALPRTAIIHTGTPYSASAMHQVDLMAGTYVFSPGPGSAVTNAPGLCPGDSGGPLYRQLWRSLSVVGINSDYTFAPGADRPFTNWHSRVDDQANHGVSVWLQSLGATVARACNHGSIPCSDVSAPDAGRPDAGRTDAAFADAPRSDAGTNVPDVALSETGTLDGSLDGSTEDGGTDGGGTVDGGALRAPRRGEIVITEIMYNPTELGDEVGEWFELRNTTANRLTLAGCTISTRSATETLTSAVEIAADGSATIARTRSVRFTPNATFNLALANSNGLVALRCAGVEIDAVSYQASGFPTGVSGASIQTSPGVTASDNDSGRVWCLATANYGGGNDRGTPGAVNRSCVTGGVGVGAAVE